MKPIYCLLAALLVALSFAGCGQSGPLYIPGDPSSIEAPPEAETNDKEGEENGEDAEESDSP